MTRKKAIETLNLIPDKNKPAENVLSQNITLPRTLVKTTFVHPLVEKSYHYSEISRIQAKVAAESENRTGNCILIASPDGNTGTSLLAAALGYYSAYACQQKVLLVDCDIAHPTLHTFFNIPQSHGIADLIQNNVSGREIIKGTGTDRLHIITTGVFDDNVSTDFRHYHIENLYRDVKSQFDLIIFDTSPVLQNNVNIASLSSVTDYCVLVVNKSVTTKSQLIETKKIIEGGNGKIDAIIINEHKTDK